MNKITLNVAYVFTAELNCFYMNLVSLQSLFDNNENNNINLYVVYEKNLDTEKLNKINCFKKYKNCLNINYIEGNINPYTKLKEKINFPDVLYLFDLINKINCEKLMYISSLSIVCNDIANMYNTKLNNNAIAACEYIYSNDIMNPKKDKIFNFSVLLMNIEKIKKVINNGELEKNELIKKLVLNQKASTIYLFNSLISDCKYLNLKNNYTEQWRLECPLICSQETKITHKKLLMHIETPIIITFFGIKPIDEIPCKNSYVNIWWRYAKKSPIYNKIKDYQNVNKYKLSSTSAQNSFKYTWLLSRIWPYIKPYWFRILLGFAIAIPLGLLDGVTAFALKPYMDYVVGGKTLELSCNGIGMSISSMQMAYILPVCVVVFAAIQGVLRYLNDYLSAWTSAHITNDVKFDLFHRLIHMHPQFFDENSSGIVISRYMGDPGAASAGIVDNIKTITTSLCGALGLIAVMLYSSWKLALIGVLVLCIAFIPVALIRKRIKETSNKNMVIGGKITTNINETYSGNKVMAAYGFQDRQENYFREKVWEGYNVGMSLLKRAGWMSPLMYLIASFGIATVLGVGTYLINSGQMTAGSFASFVTSLLLLYKPVKTLGGTLTGIQGIFVAMGRVFELFDLEPAIKDCENPKELKGLNNCIDFENVNFEYVPNNPVLKNLNLHINKNETLAIVGNSGGGKSTLVNLLPRFYDIKSGSIKFDGADIREFSLNSLRENISMVFQDNFLYSGTIKENIMLGNPNATAEELQKAIESAHLQDMIAGLPDGIDTVIGERGTTLSGGQRQR
ncbi:ATP-binding cassette domain-containing protein, partial [bacterium]|nr:ATP-binding cassette domain-containing protein [bacterium]